MLHAHKTITLGTKNMLLPSGYNHREEESNHRTRVVLSWFLPSFSDRMCVCVIITAVKFLNMELLLSLNGLIFFFPF